MKAQAGRRSGEVRDVCIGAVILIGLVFVVRGWVGCGGEKEPTAQAQSGLPARLAGEWVSKDKERTKLFFSNGTSKLVVHDIGETAYSFTSASERTITVKTTRSDRWNGGWRDESKPFDLVIEVEFASEDEIVLIYPEDAHASPYIRGRFHRSTPSPPKAPPPDTSPLAVARQQVQRIEGKLNKVESLRADAVREKDGMVAKLREMGVGGAADLKVNTRARGMAENLAKLAAEIEGMDSQLATIDAELLKARSIVRRMEREQAGISDDEMRQLSAQLRDAEARTDAAPTPITPLDVDAAVEAALKGQRTKPGDKR